MHNVHNSLGSFFQCRWWVKLNVIPSDNLCLATYSARELKIQNMGATREPEPRKLQISKCWGVRDFLARPGRPLLCTWASPPSRPSQATSKQGSRTVAPRRQPNLRAARRGPAPPPHVLTLTLAHPVAARHAWGPPRAHGEGDLKVPLLPFSPLLPFPRYPPNAWAHSHLSRVRGSHPGLVRLWDPGRARSRKASGCAHVPGSGSGRGGTCGAKPNGGAGRIGQDG